MRVADAKLRHYASAVPSTVATLLAAVDLKPAGCVPWGTRVPEMAAGVYLVSISRFADAINCQHLEAPLSTAALDQLRAACPALTLDGKRRPDGKQLAARIGSYWLPDETVLYIGLAGQPLRTRVRQYYQTPLGAARPHRGGWWLKTLTVLTDLHVHFAPTADFKDAEEDMLRAFASNISDVTRSRLPPGDPIMPFANLRDGDWKLRSHGIAGATASAAGTPQPKAALRPLPSEPPPPASAGSTAPTTTTQLRSQNVTAKDIEAGQVRIPRGATKAALPRERTDVKVVLHGHELGRCRWDPRSGPPERSGVIRIGTSAARKLLAAGDALVVTIASNGIVGLA